MMIPILIESISAVIKMKSMAGFLPTEDVDMGAQDTSAGASTLLKLVFFLQPFVFKVEVGVIVQITALLFGRSSQSALTVVAELELDHFEFGQFFGLGDILRVGSYELGTDTRPWEGEHFIRELDGAFANSEDVTYFDFTTGLGEFAVIPNFFKLALTAGQGARFIHANTPEILIDSHRLSEINLQVERFAQRFHGRVFLHEFVEALLGCLVG